MPKKFRTPTELFDIISDFSNRVCELANKKDLLFLDLMEKGVEIMSKLLKEMREEEEDA